MTNDTPTELELSIKEFISKSLLFSETFPYDNDASFLAEGIIDSMGVMELVAFVGQTFQIQVPPEDITPANFDSVSKLAAYIRKRRAL